MATVDVDLGDLDEGAPAGEGPPQYYHAPFYGDLKACTACPIRREAKQVVPGDGPADAGILLLGQNPGDEEDKDGRCFVGRAGKELDKWLEVLGLNRGRLVVSNVVHCHTTANREPTPAEVAGCELRWLPKELEYLQRVTVILTLGNPATRAVLGKDALSTGSLQVYWADVKGPYLRPFTVYPVAHPAYIVRSTAHRERMYRQVLPELRGVLQRNHPGEYERSKA